MWSASSPPRYAASFQTAVTNFDAYLCKRSHVGFQFHHIDGDSSNTVDENLAVLCVEDHDKHHRPGKYDDSSPNHLELGPDDILRFKNSWEAFVVEARQPSPKVLATLSSYGTYDLIHSLQIVFQWPDERTEYSRSFHLLDGDLDCLTDQVMNEVQSIGPKIKLAVINQPLPVEHCPCCGSGFYRTMKPAVAARLTDPAWATSSACVIYINPQHASLTLTFFLDEKELFRGSLHLCRQAYLHYHSEGIDERVPVKPKPSIRAQVTQIVHSILREWQPAIVLIGTGEVDRPNVIEDLELPKVWELGHRRSPSKSPRKKRKKR